MDSHQALFELSIKDNTEYAFKHLEMRLNSIEANHAMDKLENKIDNVGQAAGETANSKTHGIAAFAVAAGIAVKAVDILVESLMKAARWLQQTISQSVRLASELETSQIVFTNIFEGNSKAADAFLLKLEGMSKTLRVEFSQLSGLARTLLPDTQSVDEFERLAEAAVLLTKADPSQNLEGARFALEEAVSGSFKSLVGRFEVPREFSAMAKQLQENGVAPLQATLTSLEAFFKKSGLNLESFNDTFETAVSNLKSTADLAKTSFGAPMLEEIKTALLPINQFLSDNIDEIKLMAFAFGDMIASLSAVSDIDLAGFLEDFNPEPIFETIDSIGDMIQSGKVVTQVFMDFISALWEIAETVSPLGLLVDKTSEFVEGRGGLKGAAIAFVQVTSLSTAFYKKLGAGIEEIVKGVFKLENSLYKLVTGDFTGAMDLAKEGIDQLRNSLDAGDEEAREAVLLGKQRVDELTASWDRNNDALAARRTELLKGTAAEEQEIATIMRRKQAEKELQAQLDKAKSAQSELNEIRGELATRAIEKQISAVYDMIDAEVDASRRLEDIAIAEKRMRIDQAENIAKARETILSNASEAEREIELDAAYEYGLLRQDKIDADIDREKNYQRTLQDIKTNFAKQAREAAINNDAIAYLQAKRAMQDEIEAAKKAKDEQASDEDNAYKKQAADFKKALREQRGDLDESVRKQLQSLEESIADQDAAYAKSRGRQEEDYRLSLARQEEDRKVSYAREEEALKRSLNNQIAELRDTYGKDFVDVTADSLQAQAMEYEATFGPDGIVEETMNSFFDKQYSNLDELEEKLRAVQEVKENRYVAIQQSGAIPYSVKQALGIGQAGLVTDFLTNPTSRISPPTPRGGNSNTTTSNSKTEISMNLTGMEPYIQRIAVQAATEVYRNALAGG